MVVGVYSRTRLMHLDIHKTVPKLLIIRNEFMSIITLFQLCTHVTSNISTNLAIPSTLQIICKNMLNSRKFIVTAKLFESKLYFAIHKL